MIKCEFMISAYSRSKWGPLNTPARIGSYIIEFTPRNRYKDCGFAIVNFIFASFNYSIPTSSFTLPVASKHFWKVAMF